VVLKGHAERVILLSKCEGRKGNGHRSA
jgi:hypothetical protein